MIIMKKTILFGTVLTSILLSGCGGRIVNDVPNDKPSITYKYYEAGYGQYNKSQIDKFNARARKGEFDFYVKGVPDSAISGKLKSILEQAAESDKVVVPDVVLINELNPSLNGLKGYLASLDDVYATEVESAASPTGKMKVEDKLMPQSLKGKYNFTGHYYGLPMQAGTTGIIYNKKLFDKVISEMKGYANLKNSITKSFGKEEWEKVRNNLELLDKLALYCTNFKLNDEIKYRIKEETVFETKYEDDNFIESLPNFKDHIMLSTDIVYKILPKMLEGKRYDEAMEEIYSNFSKIDDKEKSDLLVPITIDEDITNQRVIRSLTQTRKVLNAIIKKYGLPKKEKGSITNFIR